MPGIHSPAQPGILNEFWSFETEPEQSYSVNKHAYPSMTVRVSFPINQLGLDFFSFRQALVTLILPNIWTSISLTLEGMIDSRQWLFDYPDIKARKETIRDSNARQKPSNLWRVVAPTTTTTIAITTNVGMYSNERTEFACPFVCHRQPCQKKQSANPNSQRRGIPASTIGVFLFVGTAKPLVPSM